MKKFFLLLTIIFLMTGCGGEKNSNDTKSPKYSRIITIGFDEFAPMGFTDENGNVVGFDVDLAKEAAKRMGVKFEFRMIDWNNKEMEIKSGNVDMIWNGCDIMDEYKKYMIFSKPYMDNRQILLVNKGNPKDIHSVSDLTGKIVGTQAGSNSETYIDENESLRNSFAKFKTYHNINSGFAALNKGEFDALIIDEIAARYEVNKNPDMFEVVEVTIGPATKFGIGFRKGNTDLRDKVQNVFDGMIKDGTAKKISEKWFGADLIK
ncbi:MAG: amino acid ABC transporter substrate-binding protein [Selenomonadaceae bacterium]|nr:amino acid ABC transporter substrate-binding protein [Selenomonadaceae bacterium]